MIPVPMGYKATIRAMEAAERLQQRDSQRRLRDLERQAKEQARLSAVERDRLEVETFDNQLEVPASTHVTAPVAFSSKPWPIRSFGFGAVTMPNEE